MTTQRPRRLGRGDAILATATSLFCSWATWQSFVNYSGWLVPAGALVAMVVGGVLGALAIAATGVPRRLAGPSAEFWGGGALTRAIAASSLYACGSLAWSIAVLQSFGSRA